MKKGQDILVKFPGLFLIHQNIPGKQVPLHSHTEHILFLPLQGEIKVFVKDTALSASPGRMVFLSSQTPHAFDSSSLTGERLIVMLDPKMWKLKNAAGVFPLSQLCKELLFYLLLHPKTKNAKILISTFVETLNELFVEGMKESSIEHLLSKSSDPRVLKALAFLEEHLSEKISTPQVAKAAGLSVRNLNRLFLTEVQYTPLQVLTQLRVDRAKVLIEGGQQTVTEAAFEVGYNSLSQFIAVFRKTLGRLPSDYLPR